MVLNRCRKFENYPIEPKPVCKGFVIFDGLCPTHADRRYGQDWYAWWNEGLKAPPR